MRPGARNLLYPRQLLRGTRPSIASSTPYQASSASDLPTITYAYTSATGNVVALCTFRTNSGPMVDFAATFDGAAMNKALVKDVIHTSSIAVVAFWLKGVPTGSAKNLIITPNDGVRDHASLVLDINNMADVAVGATFSNATETAVATTTIAGTIAPVSKRSLLLAFGGLSNGASDPFTTAGPWAEIAENQSGTGTDKADVASIYAQLNNSLIDPVAFSSVSAAPTPASFMGVGMLELLPG